MKGKRYKQLLTEIESEKDLSKKRKPTTFCSEALSPEWNEAGMCLTYFK